jgi:hypothetical protein
MRALEDYTRERCASSGKLKYRDEQDARAALVGCIMRRQAGDRKRRETDVYECRACGRWHLTSMVQPRRREA